MGPKKDVKDEIEDVVKRVVQQTLQDTTMLAIFANLIQESVTAPVAELSTALEESRGLLNKLKLALDDWDKKIRHLECRINDMEQYQRRQCLRIFGVPEVENEDTDVIAIQVAEKTGVSLQCITNVHDTMDTNTNAPSISSTPPTEALIRCKRPIPPSESSSSNPTAHIDSLSQVSPYNTDGETTANPKNHSKLNPPRKKSKKVKPPTLDQQLHPVKHILEATPIHTTQKKNLTTTQDIIQSSVKGIENWAKETGFKFSANKSECILFSKRNTPHAQPQLYLNNNKLPIVNTIKFLGIIFDRKLTWAPHLAALKEDCLRRISFLKTLAARNWGADYKVLMCTYRILIRSKLDYGCIVYNSAKSSSLQKLYVIQNSALRIALGAFRTSPIASLQIEADELPLDIRRKQLSISYALKIAASSRSNMNIMINNKYIQHPFLLD
ncbi:hypothetical protein ANN_16389 [Periplaneta americana]|uniref:Uncharacterized protein n=1 Tax=Periplaneta americana TaxID=6978 RepID=A0ABQ8SKR9_PERAM|nr:hypothetical protein ANN_16389 [Periplaneta americana]